MILTFILAFGGRDDTTNLEGYSTILHYSPPAQTTLETGRHTTPLTETRKAQYETNRQRHTYGHTW